MSLQCQKIEIKKLPFYASDITNFTSAVCAVVTEMSSFGEPLFESWAATYSGDLYDTFTTVNTYSSFWQQTDDNNVNTFVYSNSANILQSNSVVNNTSGNWNSVYNSYNSSSASFLTNSSADIRYVKLSGDVMTGGLSSPSLSTNNLYVAGSTINFFDETGNVIQTLKSSDVGNFKSNYTLTNSRSGIWDQVYSDFSTQSGNNSSVYNTVQTNSGNWNYQGNDVKSLTGNWENTYSIMSSSSANWNNVYSVVQTNSSQWAIDTSIDTGVRALTSNWENTYIGFSTQSGNNTSVYNSFNSNSSNYDSVYNIVNSNSATNWNYQGTDLKNLSSNWENTYNTVQDYSALWIIDNSIDLGVRALTSNWENTYTNFSVQSGNNINVYNTVNSNSALWIGGGGGDVEVNSFVYTNSANILQVDTNVNNNSGNWNYSYHTILTGGTIGGNVSVSGNLSAWTADINYIDFNSTIDAPPYQEGRLFYDNADNTLSLYVDNPDVTLNIGQELWVLGVNKTGSIIPNGTVVYLSGAQGNRPKMWPALANNDLGSADTIGLTTHEVAINAEGYITTEGIVSNINTSSFVEGATLYLSPTIPGGITDVKPHAPDHLVKIGYSLNATNNGKIFVSIDNGYELDELHNVKITNVQNADILKYNSTSSIWVNGSEYNGSDVKSLTGNWENTYTNFSIQSANNLSVYNNVYTNSAYWQATTGGGGGGIIYYFNQATLAQSPTTNIPITAHQLGRAGLSAQTIYTSPDISQVSYSLVAGFLTDVLDPNTTVIPAGVWDFNVWGYTNANINNPTVLQAVVYTYDGVNAPVLISTSDDTTLTDSGIFIQHAMSCLIPQTSISLTDRIYVEFRAKASAGLKTVTLAFGDATPSHLHTTLPSVGGTGLVKVVDGVLQSPASLLVDADVASGANISQSKINGLTDIANKTNSTYNTVNSNSATTWNYQGSDLKSLSGNWENTYNSVNNNSAFWNSVYNSVNSNSATTWNYQGTDLKSLTSNWQSTYSTVDITSANWNSVYSSFNSQSANNSSVFSTVQTNSATTWNYQGTDIKSLTSNWQNTYTNFSIQSANNISTYSTVQSNSSTWGTGGGSGVDTEVRALTGNWQSTYSTVQSNSSTWGTGGGGGGGLPVASYSRWQLVGAESTTVYSISGATMTAPEAYRVTINAIIQDPVIYTIDAVADTITFSSVPPLSSDIIVIENKIIGSDVTSLTANWENTSSVVQTNSASWAGAGGSTNIWIPAAAWIPRTTSGCGVDSRELATNRQNFDELLFDAASNEFAQALTILPNNYNNGTITSRFYWTASTGSGDVVWGVQGRAFANDDALDSAFGTAQTVTDSLLTINDMHVSDATAAVTFAGTPAANTPIQLQIYRDAAAGGDTMANDARLLGVEIIYTTA